MILAGGYMGAKYVDRSTGEVLEEPEFVKTYIRELCAVRGVNSTQMHIFNFFLKQMNDYNEVSFGPRAKRRFLDDHNLKNQSFNNSVAGLINSGLVERIGRGEFRINKKYAVKVPWDKVQSIKWESEYTKDGKKETVTVEYDN